jgi:hypothetical protein
MPVPNVTEKISDTVLEIPMSYKEGMRVPARIYATEKLLGEMDDGVFDQVTNSELILSQFKGIEKHRAYRGMVQKYSRGIRRIIDRDKTFKREYKRIKSIIKL